MPAEAGAGRPLRADARRNRDLLLVTAAELFGEQGVEAPLEEIARRAGVGIGTLYRHFPTRDALIAAVYRREVDLLCADVDELLDELPPDEALRAWMRRFVAYVTTKKGMAAALKAAVGADSELFVHSRQNITAAIGALVKACVADGSAPESTNPDDLMRAMSGFCLVSDQPGWQDQAIRLVDLLVDGLRYGAAAARP
jgi:AcrR family transcriptional regulator